MKHTPLVLSAVLLGALAGSAAALDDPAFFVGELTGKGAAKAKGMSKQTTLISAPSTSLDLFAGAGRFNYTINDASLGGPMKPGRKGSFKVTKPAEEDLESLHSQVRSFISDQFGVNVTVVKVKVKGSHKPSTDGTTVESTLTLSVKGTTVIGTQPFKAKATLHYTGGPAA